MTEPRIALVTGGSRGIGQATCMALAEQGVTVAVHFRNQLLAAAATTAALHTTGAQASAFQADLSQPQGADDLIAAVIAQYGHIDILVNNAAEMTDASVESMSDDVWEQTISLNLSSAFRCSRACLPSMKARGWGRIINVTSQAAYSGSANHAHYAASKAGLAGLTYSIAKEVGGFGITVNLVAPGRILTDMLTERMTGREEEWLKQTPLRRFGQPKEVADVIAFLCSDKASYVTGATLHVNGGVLMS